MTVPTIYYASERESKEKSQLEREPDFFYHGPNP